MLETIEFGYKWSSEKANKNQPEIVIDKFGTVLSILFPSIKTNSTCSNNDEKESINRRIPKAIPVIDIQGFDIHKFRMRALNRMGDPRIKHIKMVAEEIINARMG